MNYSEKELVRIAKRENNSKRGYLVVNPLQGKHIPVRPSKALELFEQLSHLMDGKYKGERILFIGFAETATAIGAQVAITQAMPYIQTTRENVQEVEYLYFSEVHSHAVEQKLVKNDIDSVINSIDRVIFVEDEVTTGNTILNIINLMGREYGEKLRFAVASLLNGMTDEYLEVYAKRNIELIYVLKTDHSEYDSVTDDYLINGNHHPADIRKASDYKEYDIDGCADARRVVDSVAYKKACEDLACKVMDEVSIEQGSRILVVGTEEFMYPALYVGRALEQAGADVRCHSTTRSPIATSMEPEYPLHERYELCSPYDRDRRTFIYDLDSYDQVLVITDSKPGGEEGISSLINALKRRNNNIYLFRWC